MRVALLLTAAIAASGQTLSITPLANPAGSGSTEPAWTVGADESAILSWIERGKDGAEALRFAQRRGQTWMETRTVIDHRRFFKHPAEAPAVLMAGKRWFAHWVEMPNPSSEAEFVYLSSSSDGVSWASPVQAHRDHSQVQHGLASMLAEPDGGVSIFFLESLKGDDGPTYLMRSLVDAGGKMVNEERLDADVCSCCPITAVKTAKGVLLAYRDHTQNNIRDISILRFENGKWSAPKTLNADNWQIDACPVNAAAAAANGSRVAVSWYTAAQNSPRVLMALSSDSGATFAKPITVSTARAHGYTSAALDESDNAIVSWIEQGANGSRILARRITAAGAAGPVLEVAKGDRAALGYPKLVRAGREIMIAWTAGGKVQTAAIR
jgi:BNR repeat-like domain